MGNPMINGDITTICRRCGKVVVPRIWESEFNLLQSPYYYAKYECCGIIVIGVQSNNIEQSQTRALKNFIEHQVYQDKSNIRQLTANQRNDGTVSSNMNVGMIIDRTVYPKLGLGYETILR